MSKSAALGLVSGLAIVVVTLIVVALVNPPAAEGAVSAGLDGRSDCHPVQVAQDQGYAFTRKVQRNVCD